MLAAMIDGLSRRGMGVTSWRNRHYLSMLALREHYLGRITGFKWANIVKTNTYVYKSGQQGVNQRKQEKTAGLRVRMDFVGGNTSHSFD